MTLLPRRTFLQAAGGGLASLASAQPRRPNVLLILSDDQGYGDLSLHGNRELTTPNLDRLAADGVEFTRFYVSPVCAPTRSALMTGRYNLRSNVHGVTGGMETMRPEENTIAETMRAAGYRTAIFGKWHLGQHYPYVPHARGFEQFIGFRTGHWINYWDPRLERNGAPYPVKGYITEALTDLGIRFLEENRTRPFFLYMAYNVPHAPFQVPEHYWRQFEKRGLDERTAAAYALTACLDDNIGRLMRRLEELGLARDTIVFFLSDNGPNGQRYNAGLRGAKGSVYEGGNRVPFFARWPGALPAGKKVDTIAAHIDLYPTIEDMCGVRGARRLPRDGKSIYPLMIGSSAGWPDRMLFTHAEKRDDPSAMFPGTVRTQRFNLVNGKDLYDISADPGEQHNVSAQYPAEARRLRNAYESWFKDALPAGGFRRLPIPIGYAEENPAFLPAPEGYLHGRLEYYGKAGWAHDWVTNWKSTNDSIDWEIDVSRDGRYAVSLVYLCPPADVGSRIEVRVGSQSASAVVRESTSMEPIPMKDVIPRTETPEMHWSVLPVGVLNLRKGNGRLMVKALSLQGSSALDLHSVLLKRLD